MYKAWYCRGICENVFLIIMTWEDWCGGTALMHLLHLLHPPESLWRGDCQTRTVNFSTVNVRTRSRRDELGQDHYLVTNDQIVIYLQWIGRGEPINRKCCKVIWIFLFVWKLLFLETARETDSYRKSEKNSKLAVMDIFFEKVKNIF